MLFFYFFMYFDQIQVKEDYVQFAFMYQASFSLRKRKAGGHQLFHLKTGLVNLPFESFSNLKNVRRCFQGSCLGVTLNFGLMHRDRLQPLTISKAVQPLLMGLYSESKHAEDYLNLQAWVFFL